MVQCTCICDLVVPLILKRVCGLPSITRSTRPKSRHSDLRGGKAETAGVRAPLFLCEEEDARIATAPSYDERTQVWSRSVLAWMTGEAATRRRRPRSRSPQKGRASHRETAVSRSLSLSLTFLSCQPSLCALLLLNSLEGASLSGSLPLSLSQLFSFRLTSSFSSLGRVRPLSSSSTPASELGRGKGSRSRRARACKVAQEGERERE